jgi:hypothetical protein
MVSDDSGRQPRCPPLLKLEDSAKNDLKIISSETAGPIGVGHSEDNLKTIPP